MNPFDDSPSSPPEPPPGIDSPSPSSQQPTHSSEPLAGDPLVLAAPYPTPVLPSSPQYPQDLQITWSWPHLIVFVLFGLVSLVMVQGILAVYYLPHGQKFSTKQMEEYLLSKPQFAIGSMLIWYATSFSSSTSRCRSCVATPFGGASAGAKSTRTIASSPETRSSISLPAPGCLFSLRFSLRA